MTQEEKDLLLKDLCVRLPYGVIIQLPELFTPSVLIDEKLKSIDDAHINDSGMPIETAKPYLRPLSSMMRGEWEEMTALIYPHGRVNCNSNNKNELLLWLNAEGSDMPIMLMDKVFSWLDKNMFDYRNLIPMGLAIEAPEGMYNK